MSKASDFVRRPPSPSARFRKGSTARHQNRGVFVKVAMIALGVLGMAFLMYLNYHVKVEHELEAARVGSSSVHEGNGILSHTRDTWSKEWRAVADRFSALGTLVGDRTDEHDEPVGNKSQIELYMLNTHQHDEHGGNNTMGAEVDSNKGRGYQSKKDTYTKFENRALKRAMSTLSKHPIALGKVDVTQPQLEDVLLQLYSQKECSNVPLFVSMANVGSQLYWQMIENYVYTLIKFDLLHCAIMICVSDNNCMRLCHESNFPCYHFDFDVSHPDLPPADKHPSVMEQIAYLKLYHIPKALQKGVNVALVDLDVGFLSNPKGLLSQFMRDTESDAYVQKDVTFIMNRTRAGWKQWWTEPMPNIGVFLVKGNDRSCKMFARAWHDYTHNTKKSIKSNPGKDQNKVAFSMSISQHRDGFRWKYIPSSQVVLVDKYFKFADMSVELGGECTENIFKNAADPTEQFYQSRFNRRNKAHLLESDRVNKTAQAIAVHTTCYEQRMKVSGLKTANAFWNPRYYDPNARTLTKKLLYDSRKQLTQEVRTLAYLSLRLKRTLIVPNVLAQTKSVEAQLRRSNKGQRPIYQGKTLWPGFRVLYEKPMPNNRRDSSVGGQSVVPVPRYEPAFYWRIIRDYEDQLREEGLSVEEARQKASQAVPEPMVVTVSVGDSLVDIERRLQASDVRNAPRLVLHVTRTESGEGQKHEQEEMKSWAVHSVGEFRSYEEELNEYNQLPSMVGISGAPHAPNGLTSAKLTDNIRLCKGILEPMMGNRSCFDKCK